MHGLEDKPKKILDSEVIVTKRIVEDVMPGEELIVVQIKRLFLSYNLDLAGNLSC